MRLLPVIFKRQLANYACAPSTYLSVAIFLALCAVLGLHSNQWMERNSSDLQAFSSCIPGSIWCWSPVIDAVVVG